MKEKKNIDRLYQEKFKDFEASPSPDLWKNISKELKEEEDRKIIPLWYKLAGAAAILALIFAGSWWANTTFQTSGTQVVFEIDDNQKPQFEFPAEENQLLQQTGAQLNSIISQNRKNNTATQNNNSRLAESGSETTGQDANNNTTEEGDISQNQNTSLAENEAEESNEVQENSANKGLTQNTEAIADSSSDREASEETKENETTSEESAISLLEEDEDDVSQKDEKKFSSAKGKNRLSLKTFAAPIVYNNMGSGNAIDPQFAQNPSSSNLSMAYGMNIAYAISDKIKIRSGIGKVSMNYDIQEVGFNASLNPQAIATISYNNESSNLRVMSTHNTNNASSAPADNNFSNEMLTSQTINGELNQQFGYIEVPLEIEYSLIDKKIGINLIGGASSLFLDENAITLNANNTKTVLGEANNLNKTSFSTNIGLGMNYGFSDNFKFNLEPIFKYQVNTFNNASGVRPFFFGVYSGISYSF